VYLQLGAGLSADDPIGFAKIMLITVGITTAVWLATTFLTRPEPMEKLVEFYRRVRPSFFGWKPVARLAPDAAPSRDFAFNLLDWICGCVMIYCSLFGVGKIILKETGLGLLFLVIAAIGAGIIYWDHSRRGWSTVMD
jgi:hypothetical protein